MSEHDTITTAFSGHETFVFRFAWLKKAIDEITKDPTIFNNDDAMVRLGVGKNMVRSIRHWALATNIIQETPGTRGGQLQPTKLGSFLLGNNGADPYLEDRNTLWLLHWNLATNERRSTTWTWAFSLYPAPEFNRDTMTNFLSNEATKRTSKTPNESSMRRDVDCFIRTYTPTKTGKSSVLEDNLDCPLNELGIIEHDTDGIYHFRRHQQPTLSDAIFAACLAEYWDRTAPGSKMLPFTSIAYGMGSPGTTFKIDENSLVDRLERLRTITNGALTYDDTAGLKQLYRHRDLEPMNYLQQHYALVEA